MGKTKEYFYEVDFKKSPANENYIVSNGFQDIEVTVPLEFSTGINNKWTSEHLIAGAIITSIIQTFIELASHSSIPIINYNCHCFIRMETKNEKLIISELLLRPIITLNSRKDVTKASQLMEKAEAICPIKNAINIPIEIIPRFDFHLSMDKSA